MSRATNIKNKNANPDVQLGSLNKMRDLIFRNLTSQDKRKKVLQAQEIINDKGVLTKIYRGFVCFLKPAYEVKNAIEHPEIHIVKSVDDSQHRETLLLKVKGGLYAVNKGELYFLSFCHSLRINIQKNLSNQPTV